MSSSLPSTLVLVDNLNSEEQLELVTYLINNKLNYDQKNFLRRLLNSYTRLAESDVIYEVFSFIDYKELIGLRLCNRKFNQFIMSDDYWSRVMKRHFGISILPSSIVGSMFTKFIQELKNSIRFCLDPLHGKYMWSKTWTFSDEHLLKIVTFQAKAANDIHVSLATAPFCTNPMYEIVLGGWGNCQSVIRRESQGGAWASISHSPCDPNQFLDYWICVDTTSGIVSCGAGSKVGEEQYMSFRDGGLLNFKYVGFSTWDRAIEYRNVKINSMTPANNDFYLDFGNMVKVPIVNNPEVFVLTMKKGENLSVKFTFLGGSGVVFPKKSKKHGDSITYYFVYLGNKVEGYYEDDKMIPKLYETITLSKKCTHFEFNSQNVKFRRISIDDFKQLLKH